MTKYYIFVVVLCTLVLVLAIVTVLISGTPSEQKAISFDRQRLHAFGLINSQINSHSRSNGLPQNLLQVSNLNTDFYKNDKLLDPETKTIYDYKIISETSYQLCTVFSSDSFKQDDYTIKTLAKTNNSYVEGYDCLTYTIEKSPSSYTTPTPTPTPTSKPTPEPIPTKATYPTIAPEAIGLTLEKTADGNSVNMKITNTSNLARIDWDLYYQKENESGNIVLDAQRGSFYNTHETDQFSQRFTLGVCRTGSCTYDKVVGDIYLSVNGITTEGRSYQVQKTLKN